MTTFLIGLAILLGGGAVYGRIVEKFFGPTDDPTPAYTKNDGVDYVPMECWRNRLIHLLNIAGTGPILGPIQGILFGPLAFITIPLGCVLAGAVHDYMVGMISVRKGGRQITGLIITQLGMVTGSIFGGLVWLTVLLFSTTCVYVPGNMFIDGVLNQKAELDNPVVLTVYGVIFLYYAVATLLPIDKIIGRVYPIIGGFFFASTFLLLFAIFYFKLPLENLSLQNIMGLKPHFFPLFFVTVACGIASGFHATQATIISRTIKSERQGRSVFYNMMIAEGFIAMVWAAVTMGAIKTFGLDPAEGASATLNGIIYGVVGLFTSGIGDNAKGVVNCIVVLGIMALPITSGDTALRSLRLLGGEMLHVDQSKIKTRLAISGIIFAFVAGLVVVALSGAEGFTILWRYFAWANQTLVIFSMAMATAWCVKNGKAIWFTLLPGAFYTAVTTCFILNAKIGLNLPWKASYLISTFLALAYIAGFADYKRRYESQLLNGMQK